MAKDMCPSSAGTTAVATMFKQTELLEANVASVVKVGFPKEFEEMRKVWAAGKIWERNTGCHNARAVIFKLPVLPHLDATDFGVSVSFAAGRFMGGCVYVPQFKLVFRCVVFHAHCIL